MKLLRYALGLFFVIFGITKIIPLAGFGYGFGGTVWFVGEAMGYPAASFIVTIAVIVEIALGLALLLPQFNQRCHVRQRLAAYGLGLFTILATLMFHLPGVSGETLTPELTNVLKNLVIVAALFAVGNEVKNEKA